MIVAGIKAGDEVICPSLSYIATANSIKYVGAKPVFAEVNEDYNIDVTYAETLITPKTKAILIVHQIGMPAEYRCFSGNYAISTNFSSRRCGMCYRFRISRQENRIAFRFSVLSFPPT